MSELRTVAALYVDPRGPYPTMPGVDCWDEARDAKLYDGPHPVVAHPPCGPWSRLSFFCTKQDADCAPRAVAQVRAFGGVLEHPACSKLWPACHLPYPGELPDAWGGLTLELDQVHWGHKAQKRTWLYVVRAADGLSHLIRHSADWRATPTHVVTTSRQARPDGLPEVTRLERRVTPTAFAELLVTVARNVSTLAQESA